MVSYTNHALDQFLEGVLSTTKSKTCLIFLLLLLLLLLSLLKPVAITINSTFPEKKNQDKYYVLHCRTKEGSFSRTSLSTEQFSIVVSN